MGLIEANRTYMNRLGWKLSDFGATSETDLVEAILKQQKDLDVTADGICGPQTYEAWLAREMQRFVCGIEDAGHVALCTAKWFWLQNIIDSNSSPKSISMIDTFIRSSLGLGWSWRKPYTANTFEWCLAFVARAWAQAGVPLKPDRYHFFASTIRMLAWAQYEPWQDTPNPPPAEGPPRLLIELDERSNPSDCVFSDGTSPREGDIVLMGGVNTGAGKHGALTENYDARTGLFTTIEGNATGVLPNGSAAHGVVRARRFVGLRPGQAQTTYFIRKVIRPSPHDLKT